MAKKSRKARYRGKVAGTSQQKAQPVSTKAQVNAAATTAQPQNYSYVKSDLVRIAVIAGALILVLIILTFVPALKS